MKLSPPATIFLLLLIIQQHSVAQQKKLPANKAAVIASVNAHEQALIKLSDEIWAYAEIAFKETQSSKVLADYAEAQGFRVATRGCRHPYRFYSYVRSRRSHHRHHG
jgi:aminobenzoyl-glutamate utilization protein B